MKGYRKTRTKTIRMNIDQDRIKFVGPRYISDRL